MKKLFKLTSALVVTLLFTAIYAFALTPTEVRTQPLGSAVTVTGYAFSGTVSDGTGFGNEFYLSDRSNRPDTQLPSQASGLYAGSRTYEQSSSWSQSD